MGGGGKLIISRVFCDVFRRHNHETRYFVLVSFSAIQVRSYSTRSHINHAYLLASVQNPSYSLSLSLSPPCYQLYTHSPLLDTTLLIPSMPIVPCSLRCRDNLLFPAKSYQPITQSSHATPHLHHLPRPVLLPSHLSLQPTTHQL